MTPAKNGLLPVGSGTGGEGHGMRITVGLIGEGSICMCNPVCACCRASADDSNACRR